MPYCLTCFIPDGKGVFIVRIDETKTVGHLKDEIKKKQEPTFDGLDAHALTLYKTNVDLSDKSKYREIIDQISKSSYVFTPKEFLNPAKRLDTFFGSPGPIKVERSVHILVLPPGRELLDPRMWCRF